MDSRVGMAARFRERREQLEREARYALEVVTLMRCGVPRDQVATVIARGESFQRQLNKVRTRVAAERGE